MTDKNPVAEATRVTRNHDRRTYDRRVIEVARVCRRIEAGEALTEICRDPTMPARTTVMSWATRYPELRLQLEAARATQPEQRRVYRTWSDDIVAEFLARIEAGRGLVEVCAEGDMPAHATITRWLNERPEFAERYRRARERQADRLFDLAWRIACDAEGQDVRAARLRIETLKWRIGRISPRKYGPWKAQAPQDPSGDGTKRYTGIEVRRFAKTPDTKLAEITRNVRGMTQDEILVLQADIRSGRRLPPSEAPPAGVPDFDG